MNQAHIARLVDWLLSLDSHSVRDIDELMAAIALEIAAIDRFLVGCVRQVLRNAKFRQLESSFRGIKSLVVQAAYDDGSSRNLPVSRKITVFVLDISAEELRDDCSANSYRQTWLYDKLYRKRFDQLIGEKTIQVESYSGVYPFSLVVADFDFSVSLSDQTSLDKRRSLIDLSAVRKLARIGEDCFCMFLMSLSPTFFGESIRTMGKLESVMHVNAILNQSRYAAWHEFRRQDESRMIGISFPRVLIRQPYRQRWLGRAIDDEGLPVPATGITFDEFDGFPETEDYLWGRSCFAVLQPIMRSFKRYDWFADISGVDREFNKLENDDDDPEFNYDGGVINHLQDTCFKTDAPQVANYSPAEIVISESDEAVFSSLGLIPLFSINQTSLLAMLSSQTVQVTREMSSNEATNNLRLSSMFNYMLCVCRMAHRMKIECRSQIGKSSSGSEVQSHMQLWMRQHSSGRSQGTNRKMLKPFHEEYTKFLVEEDVTDPGRYDCTIQLCPHNKFDNGRTQIVFEPISLQMKLNDQEA